MRDKNSKIDRMDFFPLINHNNNLIGSQLVFKLPNKKLTILDMPNFREQDFQFVNKMCFFGKKIYNRGFKLKNKHLLFECKLREELVVDKCFLNEFDKFKVLND
jgi:hypothetical protein